MNVKASSFGWVSFAMIVGVMGTALISPLYALYQEAWQLKTSDVSLIYVVYMAGALCGLLFLGRLPDRLGFRAVMQAGLFLVLLGTLITLLAWDLWSLNAGRFVVGVASSMLTTSATLGLGKLIPARHRSRLAMITGIVIALGFGLGPLVGGMMGQWVPYPLVTTYLPTLLLGVLVLAMFRRLHIPEGDRSETSAPFRWCDVAPKMTWPVASDSLAFVLTSCLAFLSFAVFGLYASLSPLFLDKLIPWHGPVVSGTAIATILFGSALTQIICGRMTAHWCGFWGLLMLALSNGLLLVNLGASSATVFALGVTLTAIGHGMCQMTGIGMVNRIATNDTRAGLFSSYLVVGYVGTMVPIMGIGWIADHWGMQTALYAFCSGVIVIATVVAVLFQRHPRMRRPCDQV
jgi:MFS family permease